MPVALGRRAAHDERNGALVSIFAPFDTLIDTTRTVGCVAMPLTEEEKTGEFPDCCPKYDCEEGTKIFYEGVEENEAEGEASDGQPRNLN